MILTKEQGGMSASDLLATQAKKFTMDMPSGMHKQLKMIAAGNNTTLRDLIIEAVTNYTIPRYQKEVR